MSHGFVGELFWLERVAHGDDEKEGEKALAFDSENAIDPKAMKRKDIMTVLVDTTQHVLATG